MLFVSLCYQPQAGLLTKFLPSDPVPCYLIVADLCLFLTQIHPGVRYQLNLVQPQCITSCTSACEILVIPRSCVQCLHLGTCAFPLPLQSLCHHSGVLGQELCKKSPPHHRLRIQVRDSCNSDTVLLCGGDWDFFFTMITMHDDTAMMAM